MSMHIVAHGILGLTIMALAWIVARLNHRINVDAAWRAAAERLFADANASAWRVDARVTELERLWAVAKANPELIRELAVEALKGDSR